MLLGEQSDHSASLTGRRVLIKVRVSRHAEADNEPHAEATAATSAHPPPPTPLQVCGEAMCIVPVTTRLRKHGEAVFSFH